MKAKLLLTALALSVFTVAEVQAQCSVSSQPYMYCGYDDLINVFTLDGTTSNTGGSCNSAGYSNLTTPTWLLIPGQSYSWSATVGGGSWSQGMGIWIDFNGNGSFESSEGFVTTSVSTSPSGTITVPANAAGGTVKMRVRCSYYQLFSTSQACTDNHGYGWGETEDYEVTVCSPPSITDQPGGAFACENGDGIITLKASGADGYTWQMDPGNGWQTLSANSTFSNVNGDTLKLSNTPATLNGAKFRCIVGACGNASKDTSIEAKLDVYAVTNIVAQTDADTSCEGLNTKMFVKSDGVITNYKWQRWDNADSSFKDIAGPPFLPSADTLHANNILDTLSGTIIRCIVSGICGIDTTSNITMVVQKLPSVLTDPEDVTANPGDNVAFNIVAGGSNVNYQWQVGFKDTFANVNNGGVYNGSKTDKINVTGVSHAQNEFQFRCIVSGSGNCAAKPDTSSTAILYVTPPKSIGNIGIDGAISIYPNPAGGSEIVIMADESYSLKTYIISDKAGRVVKQGNLTGNATTININSLASDVYNVQLYDKDNRAVQVLRFTKL